MPDAKHYAEKLKVQIDKWADDIDETKKRIDSAAIRVKSECEKQIEVLQVRHKEIGEQLEVLKALPEDRRIGIGVVNQKHPWVEPVEEILARMRHAVGLFGRERVLFTPDCGFATFADNPVSSAAIAEWKLKTIVEAAAILRRG